MSEPKDVISIAVADGKYTVIQDASGKLKALRNGEPWRDCVGDGLILALACELEEAREQRKELLEALKDLEFWAGIPDNGSKDAVLLRNKVRAAIAKAEGKG